MCAKIEELLIKLYLSVSRPLKLLFFDGFTFIIVRYIKLFAVYLLSYNDELWCICYFMREWDWRHYHMRMEISCFDQLLYYIHCFLLDTVNICDYSDSLTGNFQCGWKFVLRIFRDTDYDNNTNVGSYQWLEKSCCWEYINGHFIFKLYKQLQTFV
jgi:hypothetical protein